MLDRTLFTLLGLDAGATTEDVEAAWSKIAVAHGGDLVTIDSEIKAAYETLREPANLELYRSLLESCDHDLIVEIPSATRSDFQYFCTRCGIRYWERPGYPNSYKVRRAGQELPDWVRYDAQATPGMRMNKRERLVRMLRNFALGEVFQGRSGIERAWILAGYVVVLLVAFGSIGWLMHTYSTWQRGLVLAAEHRSRDTFNVALAGAQTSVDELEALADSVSQEFQELTRVPLARAAEKNVRRPRELDLALIRHESVREAWTATVNQRLRSFELDAEKDALRQLAMRPTATVPTADDTRRATEIGARAKQRVAQLRAHRSNIDHIRVMMNADRFEHRPILADGSHLP